MRKVPQNGYQGYIIWREKEGKSIISFAMMNICKQNVEYLDHDTLTDVISFDYTMVMKLVETVFISSRRVDN
jgi:ssRNA-specific RNase YbeY (16S rRNA maturation enzyme)